MSEIDCIFCKIIQGKIPSEIVYKDQFCLAFRDINPQAPTHILIIPQKHIATINELGSEDDTLIGHIILTAINLAKKEGMSEKGYRLVWNCGRDAGQEVYHIHLHLLAGRVFRWPPG